MCETLHVDIETNLFFSVQQMRDEKLKFEQGGSKFKTFFQGSIVF